jgi:hypothetical protein
MLLRGLDLHVVADLLISASRQWKAELSARKREAVSGVAEPNRDPSPVSSPSSQGTKNDVRG